jgi:response regulator RpfG family c-di-GMP phosphodiesterase
MMGVTARQGKAKIPFILLTGWTDAFNQSEKIRASGVDAIVEKPVAPESLVNLIQEVKWGKQGLL